MLTPVLILAQLETPEEQVLRDAAGRGSSIFGGEMGIILGAALVLLAVLFFWAFFIRRRPQTQHGALVLERPRREDAERYGSSGRRRRRKRKAEHPENLPRNPTLSEIGGLPPLRPDEPPPGPDEGSPAQPQR